MDSLEQIDREVSSCTECALSRNRTRAVPGEGPESAAVMLIGEAPGFNEEQQGRPFVGAAGNFLNEILASIGLGRENVFITNTVKCRPPSNRDPLPGEIAACRKYLIRQMEFIAPRVVVTLGRHSMTHFLPNETIGKAHGRARVVDGITLFPMYHPAAALHQGSLRSVILEDMQNLLPLLEPPAPPEPVNEHGGEQISMF